MYILEIIVILFVIALALLVGIRKVNIVNKASVRYLFLFIGTFYFIRNTYSAVSSITLLIFLIFVLGIALAIFLWEKTDKCFSYYILNINKAKISEINGIIEKYPIKENSISLNKKMWNYSLEGTKEDVKNLKGMKKELNSHLHVHGKTTIDTWISVIVLFLLAIYSIITN